MRAIRRPSAEISLAQRAERSIDLSAEGTANCYIAHTNQSYKFNATVKGNGKGDGRSEYIANYGVNISNIATVELLWESRNDGDKSMSREIIDGAPTYSGGVISPSPRVVPRGNAVVTAKGPGGRDSLEAGISGSATTRSPRMTTATAGGRRSGHGPQPRSPEQHADGHQQSRYVLSVGPQGSLHAFAFAYVGLTIDDALNAPENNVTNYEVGNGTGEWVFDAKALPIDVVPGNIPHSIQNPMTYLQPCYSTYYTWYCMSDDPAACDSGLWDVDQKTIFDPCPVGYKVPGTDYVGHPERKQECQDGRCRGGVCRGRDCRTVELERAETGRTRLEIHRRLLSNGRQRLLLLAQQYGPQLYQRRNFLLDGSTLHEFGG